MYWWGRTIQYLCLFYRRTSTLEAQIHMRKLMAKWCPGVPGGTFVQDSCSHQLTVASPGGVLFSRLTCRKITFTGIKSHENFWITVNCIPLIRCLPYIFEENDFPLGFAELWAFVENFRERLRNKLAKKYLYLYLRWNLLLVEITYYKSSNVVYKSILLKKKKKSKI